MARGVFPDLEFAPFRDPDVFGKKSGAKRWGSGKWRLKWLVIKATHWPVSGLLAEVALVVTRPMSSAASLSWCQGYSQKWPWL